MSNTKSIEEVQAGIEALMQLTNASDFIGLTEGNDQDYETLREQLKAAHVTCGIIKVKLENL